MTSGATGFDSKVWEQVKYYYDVRAWLPKNLVIVSRKRSTRSLSRQDAVLAAAAAAETRGWKVNGRRTPGTKGSW